MAAFIILTTAGCKKEEPVKHERVAVKTQTVAWDYNVFKKLLPKPEFEEIVIFDQNEDWFGFESITVTGEQGDAYVEECKARGFTVDPVQYDGCQYLAKNADRYELEILMTTMLCFVMFCQF